VIVVLAERLTLLRGVELAAQFGDVGRGAHLGLELGSGGAHPRRDVAELFPGSLESAGGRERQPSSLLPVSRSSPKSLPRESEVNLADGIALESILLATKSLNLLVLVGETSAERDELAVLHDERRCVVSGTVDKGGSFDGSQGGRSSSPSSRSSACRK